MAVSFSIISGTASPAWLWAFQSSLGQPLLMAVSFPIISGTASPAWLWAFQSSLGQPLLHGCELFNHLWDSLSCMAVSFSIISGTASPAWLWAFQSFLGQPILHGLGQRGLHLQSPFILLFSYLSNQYDGSTTHRDHTQKQVKPSSRPARLSSIAHQVKGVVHPPLDVAPSIAHQVGGGVHPHLMSQVGREPVTGKLLKTNFGALSINRQRVGYQKKAVQKCSRNKKVKLVRRSTQLVHLYPFVRFCQESWASLSNAAGLPATANPPDQPKVPEVKQPSQATQPTACPAPAAGPSPSSRHTRFWPWSSSSPTKHPPRHPPSAGYTTRGGGGKFCLLWRDSWHWSAIMGQLASEVGTSSMNCKQYNRQLDTVQYILGSGWIPNKERNFKKNTWECRLHCEASSPWTGPALAFWICCRIGKAILKILVLCI